MEVSIFSDRHEAGRALAGPVREVVGADARPLVLGLPRGGVPPAWEIARALGADLDVLVVRKLGVPRHPELAMGAIASGGARVLNPQVIDLSSTTPAMVEQVERRERAELERRERLFRGDAPPLDVAGRTVVLVDDGLATGATMEAAVSALRSLQPGRIVVAVPVASEEAAGRISRQVEQFVCLMTPASFQAVGLWYRDFSQVSEREVQALIARGTTREAT